MSKKYCVYDKIFTLRNLIIAGSTFLAISIITLIIWKVATEINDRREYRRLLEGVRSMETVRTMLLVIIIVIQILTHTFFSVCPFLIFSGKIHSSKKRIPHMKRFYYNTAKINSEAESRVRSESTKFETYLHSNLHEKNAQNNVI